jgi:hypothetical protein
MAEYFIYATMVQEAAAVVITFFGGFGDQTLLLLRHRESSRQNKLAIGSQLVT